MRNHLCFFAVVVVLVFGGGSLNAAMQRTEPVIFAEGVISTRDYESSITFTPDSKTAYFVKSMPDLSFRVIVFSRFQQGKWTMPEVASFSGQYIDTDPCLSPDGKKLYFASRRPVTGSTPKADYDLWVVELTNTGWSEPRHLNAPVNTDSQETSPSTASDGTLYFSSTRAGGKGSADLYRAKPEDRNYSAPENLGDTINSPGPEIQVFTSADEQMLIFAAAGRSDAVGSVDLYRSRRTDGAWSKPVNLGNKINSTGVDSAPRISPDGKSFFWMSTRGYGSEDQQVKQLSYDELSNKLQSAGNSLGDIYQIDLSALPPYASNKPMPEPTIFAAGVISTGDFDSHPAFTPDGKTLYFTRSSPTFNFWTIVATHYKNNKWSTPEVISISGQHRDADPFITKDGSRFYFISDRPNSDPGRKQEKRSLDIWVMEKTANGWSAPRNLGAPVNSGGEEWYPTVASDGTLYFGSDREGGKGRTDIYRSRFVDGKYLAPENLGESINSQFDEYEPYISPDQSYLIFMAARPDGLGGTDLYISYQQNEQWTKAVNLGDKINSKGSEYSPIVSPDGKYFFWTSTRTSASPAKRLTYAELLTKLRSVGNGLGDIYQIDLSALNLLPR